MWKFMIIAFFSVIWALKASEDLGDFEKGKTGCNHTIKANTSSSFKLDLHNLSHPCFWNITPGIPGPISLFLSSVLLQDEDELTIYNNYTNALSGTNPLTKPIHSQNGTLTIITSETEIYVKLIGKTTAYDRIFEGYYIVGDCLIPVEPDVEILNSPTYTSVSEPKECKFRFNEIPHLRVKQVFSFEEFNMSASTVDVEGATFVGAYTNNPPIDFFIDKNLVTITVKQALNSSDHFKLKIHNVDKECSGVFKPEEHPQLKSPKYILNNGSIESECRWLVQSSNYHTLGLKFDKLDFKSVFDIVSVNDGLSEFSQPLLQVTMSNRNSSQNQMIRASSSNLWISFKPLSYKSSFIANITGHGQGGYFKNSGVLSMKYTTGDDTVFLLEVDNGKVVELNTQTSSFSSPATLTVYDGFDTNTKLTSLHGQIKFPVMSRSSRMMITGTNFTNPKDEFQASFRGIVPGCNHMSSADSENYILNENCNSTCQWIISPQDSPNSVLVFSLQYISLQKGDIVKVQKLDDKLTELGEIGANESHVPHFTLPANVGALITITQEACEEKKDRIVLIGHTSYIPGCIQNIKSKSPEILQISSPLYPDTYPIYANCLWNISAPKGAMVHMAFDTFSLSEKHCVTVSQKSGVSLKYEGTTLPADDVFLRGDVIVEFDSSGCNKSAVGSPLKSDAGFLLNVTVTDCGDIYENIQSGEFNTSVTSNQSICIWKVTVPPTVGDSVNILSYTVSKKDSLENYEIHVYDGSTVRKPEINNDTSEEWSRTNTLIFVYKRLNISEKSSVLVFKYNTISCNVSMQCANKICMHPDWLCNNKNDCGDYSDETGCGSIPVPTKPIPVEYSGYSATAFWLCVFAMLIIGAIAGLTIPVCYQKYRDSRYRRFHELDG